MHDARPCSWTAGGRLASIFLMWSLSTCTTGSGGEDATTADALPLAVSTAAQILLSNISVATSAEVIVVGPVPAATVLKENRSSNDTATVATLTLPATSGTYYAFFIDDHPDQKHGHAVRYAWVNTTDRTAQAVDAQYPMRLEEPGTTARPYSYASSGTVEGILFQYATGHGEGDAATTTDDQAEDGSAAAVLGTATTAGCYRAALVVDGGEERGYRLTALTADNMAGDADTIKTYVEGNGFTVTRRSQYWDSSHPGFATREHRSFEARLDRLIEAYQGVGCAPTQFCCHEFFLYIAAHGSQTGFDLYPKDGGSNAQREFYGDVMTKLRTLPTCVKTTIFVDVCESGG